MIILKGYVYLLHPIGHNVYKIGCTTDPDRRKYQIENGKTYKIAFDALIASNDYQTDEFHLQQRFKTRLVSREWFVLTPEDVEYIKGLANGK